jgi:hypothetical protein
MSLEGSPTAGKRSTLGPGMSAPGRPSRDLRRPSEGRPGTTVRVSTDGIANIIIAARLTRNLHSELLLGLDPGRPHSASHCSSCSPYGTLSSTR